MIAALPTQEHPEALCAPEDTFVPGQLIPGGTAWRIVGRCSTVEQAQSIMQNLNDRGFNVQMSMVEGLSVLACRRD